jgi:hypothetical protein
LLLTFTNLLQLLVVIHGQSQYNDVRDGWVNMIAAASQAGATISEAWRELLVDDRGP